MSTFTKLCSTITDSTIWCKPDHIRIVWITMLAMADRKGRVMAAIPGLANRARVSIEQTKEALDSFLSPDEYSRTPDDEGRRIKVIDGGWELLNYIKYRELRDQESAKEAKRAYMERVRAIKKVEKVEHGGTRWNQAEAEAEAEAEGEEEALKSKHRPAKAGSKRQKAKTAFPDDFEMTPDLAGETTEYWRAAGRPDLSPFIEFDKFRNHHKAKGSTMASWPSAWATWRSNAVQYSKPVMAVSGGYESAGQRRDRLLREQEEQLREIDARRDARLASKGKGDFIVGELADDELPY